MLLYFRMKLSDIRIIQHYPPPLPSHITASAHIHDCPCTLALLPLLTRKRLLIGPVSCLNFRRGERMRLKQRNRNVMRKYRKYCALRLSALRAMWVDYKRDGVSKQLCLQLELQITVAYY